MIIFFSVKVKASESQQYNFPAYGAFRVKSHIKIALEDFPCVVGDVNSVCHLVNKKDKMSVRAETGASIPALAPQAPSSTGYWCGHKGRR